VNPSSWARYPNRASSPFLQQIQICRCSRSRDNEVIFLSANLPVSLWRCHSIDQVEILFLVVELTLVAVVVVRFRFAAGALVPFGGAPACSGTQTNCAFADPTGDQNRAARLRFHVSFVAAANFPARAGSCAVPGSSAPNARHCGGNPGGPLGGEKASVPACSSPAAVYGGADPLAAR
jgi:hypothetical protein